MHFEVWTVSSLGALQRQRSAAVCSGHVTTCELCPAPPADAGRAASVSMSSAQSRTKGGPSAPDMFMFGVGVATATWAIVQLQRALRGNSAAYAAADKKEAVEYFESGAVLT